MARRRIPSNGIIASMQMSGALHYYTDLTYAMWNWLDSERFALLRSSTESRGYRWYALLAPFEVPEVAKNLPGDWRAIDRTGDVVLWELPPAPRPIGSGPFVAPRPDEDPEIRRHGAADITDGPRTRAFGVSGTVPTVGRRNDRSGDVVLRERPAACPEDMVRRGMASTLTTRTVLAYRRVATPPVAALGGEEFEETGCASGIAGLIAEPREASLGSRLAKGGARGIPSRRLAFAPFRGVDRLPRTVGEV
jgi:hypothetical protein